MSQFIRVEPRNAPKRLKLEKKTTGRLLSWRRSHGDASRRAPTAAARETAVLAQVVANASMKKQLKEIEDKILYMLSNSTGNILDDHELIEPLASSKITSTEITEKVADAEVTEKEIDAYRERYRPVAYRATILYFSVVNLCVVDPMYQY